MRTVNVVLSSRDEKILDNIDDILDGKSNFIEQDHYKATYASKIEKSEGQIDWHDDANNIIAIIISSSISKS